MNRSHFGLSEFRCVLQIQPNIWPGYPERSWGDALTANVVLKHQLDDTESDLLTMLERLLPICANEGTLLFVNSENLPKDYRDHWLPEESDKLLALATRSVALRTKLAMEITETIGQLFLAACMENADTKNQHRRGPRKLATWLLAEIESVNRKIQALGHRKLSASNVDETPHEQTDEPEPDQNCAFASLISVDYRPGYPERYPIEMRSTLCT